MFLFGCNLIYFFNLVCFCGIISCPKGLTKSSDCHTLYSLSVSRDTNTTLLSCLPLCATLYTPNPFILGGRLFVTERDATFGQIIGRHLNLYFVTGKNLDVVHPHLS